MSRTLVFQVTACFLLFFLLFLAAPVSARTWSGVLLDKTTGNPLEGVTIQAGIRGRVDAFPGYKVFSGRDGSFSVTWHADSWNAWNAGTLHHYLRIESSGYWSTVVVRKQPEQDLRVPLTPLNAHVRGQLVHGLTNRPLADITVALGDGGSTSASPGRVAQSVKTDANGYFVFQPQALFEEVHRRGALYDYPPDLGLSYNKETGPYRKFFVTIYGDRSYVNEWLEISPLGLLPSNDPSIHTFATVKAEEHGTGKPLPPMIRSELRGQVASILPPLETTGVQSPNLEALAQELRGMIRRAEANRSAHPDFLAALYQWLDALEREITSPQQTWGAY